MAWKKYKDKSPEEKKASWGRFAASSALKKKMGSHKEDKHTDKHTYSPNPGGYCKDCGWGRDHS